MDGIHGWLGTWQKHVDRLIVVSAYERDKYIAGGWPVSKIKIKYNTVFERTRAATTRRHFRRCPSFPRRVAVLGLAPHSRRGSAVWLSPEATARASSRAGYEDCRGSGSWATSRAPGCTRPSPARSPVVLTRWLAARGSSWRRSRRSVPIIASRRQLTELVEASHRVRVGDAGDMARALRQVAESDELAERWTRARARYDKMRTARVTVRELFAIYRGRSSSTPHRRRSHERSSRAS
jgi:glycosyltransferase involved in cell wall biosynthesis